MPVGFWIAVGIIGTIGIVVASIVLIIGLLDNKIERDFWKH